MILRFGAPLNVFGKHVRRWKLESSVKLEVPNFNYWFLVFLVGLFFRMDVSYCFEAQVPNFNSRFFRTFLGERLCFSEHYLFCVRIQSPNLKLAVPSKHFWKKHLFPKHAKQLGVLTLFFTKWVSGRRESPPLPRCTIPGARWCPRIAFAFARWCPGAW